MCFLFLSAQTRIRETRKAVMAEPVRQLKTDNADAGEEYEFWSELRNICLLPEQAAFNQSGGYLFIICVISHFLCDIFTDLPLLFNFKKHHLNCYLFNHLGELGDKLGELRDTCLFVLTVANVLWLVFMITVMEQDEELNILGSSFASVAFLAVYTLVLVFQFLSMLWHRFVVLFDVL